MQYSDQFAPGFAGIVFGLPIILAILLVGVVFRREIIHFTVTTFYHVKRSFSDTEAEFQQEIENERNSRKED